MVMLKENHLELAGGIDAAVRAVRAHPRSADLPITVEVTTYEEAMEAAALDVDRLLLDNMSLSEMARVASALSGGPRPELEASGSLRPEKLADVAATGVDRISIGALTHSAPSADVALEVRPGGAVGRGAPR